MPSTDKATSQMNAQNGNESNRENPKSGLQDANPKTHSTSGGVKKDLSVEKSASRSDQIDQQQARKPRDNA